jgi:hypothetical protein
MSCESVGKKRVGRLEKAWVRPTLFLFADPRFFYLLPSMQKSPPPKKRSAHFFMQNGKA